MILTTNIVCAKNIWSYNCMITCFIRLHVVTSKARCQLSFLLPILFDFQKKLSGFDVHRSVHRNNISTVKPTRCTKCIKFILFWNDTLHVSDCLSVRNM